MPERRTVALVTLGCARNEVDSEELAGRLAADGWELVEEAADADVAVVNTCGFVEAAKKDSVDALLEANDLKDHGRTQAVVAVGCMAERYGKELAEALPEADGVLGFDDYADISTRLQTILSGGSVEAHAPRDRRKLLPLSPVQRQEAAAAVALPGHSQEPAPAPADLPEGIAPASGPRAPLRRRLDTSPVASVKLASGCDRRCSFCAIPSFRGSFVSRRPSDVLGETRWLAEQGVKEIMLVSENNTSYGKDLGDIRLLETLLPELAAVDGIERVRVSYLQPAEMRPGLIDVLTSTEKVAPYFDLSFQHSAPEVLRSMRRFGDTDRFLELLDTIRGKAPQAGVRSNFIVGFPGESEEDFAELERFITHARLDAIGVFGYSDEDGTEAATYENKLDQDVVDERLAHLSRLAEELTAQRAEERLGETLEVLVESVDGTPDGDGAVGRAAHQAPETDGQVVFTTTEGLVPGRMVTAKAVGTEGVDLVAECLEEAAR
ncbi:30S ribosomal protein S12 methylthiotransferase RimO [Streptomyces sp. WAC05374]|uniref:30S ribosomal protein S12 methylthiotransferase RimO n=1 Tax=Streptomyces sp. WAC05374 TaxID=2487420 RepID=UPI000F895DD4|nr:30S ribosomal protein S12 methylthiotransferase RimO [Streptomyces sp. WAC05374]RST11881.1 30S ribosomal protein S12 methylthiotransferase RimO [Streptomyces sp. WAC05374]TDF43728.1 30S ribosomal protein S12 methylthiotransferase RimO [Streptomyces sp. WAC05374]TDF52104.1 30S ribosomal protein S12 methylthiotransferase RimO [Streptomyces sp. WAC05374]TDF54459.1 30S ribosomal protein S12 methylthiotransferase RimO [Streptomyces sp. WAC05374]